jgi:hypothetical protein
MDASILQSARGLVFAFALQSYFDRCAVRQEDWARRRSVHNALEFLVGLTTIPFSSFHRSISWSS